LAKRARYYFITLTSSPQSPDIERSWRALRQKLKRDRSHSCWCYCITSEGNGVIHMILRLGKDEQRIDKGELRAYWFDTHKAYEVDIQRVGTEKEKENLARYISDQREGKKLGGEMAWQDKIVRWHWSKGWIPKGYGKVNGKLFCALKDAPIEIRNKELKESVQREFNKV
jgi:hypothetical protein